MPQRLSSSLSSFVQPLRHYFGRGHKNRVAMAKGGIEVGSKIVDKNSLFGGPSIVESELCVKGKGRTLPGLGL